MTARGCGCGPQRPDSWLGPGDGQGGLGLGRLAAAPFEARPQSRFAGLVRGQCRVLGAGLALAPKQTIEVMPHHGPVLAAVLKQKTGECRLHQAVLIPLRMTPHKVPHGVIKILGELVLDADAEWGVIGDRSHADTGGRPIHHPMGRRPTSKPDRRLRRLRRRVRKPLLAARLRLWPGERVDAGKLDADGAAPVKRSRGFPTGQGRSWRQAEADKMTPLGKPPTGGRNLAVEPEEKRPGSNRTAFVIDLSPRG